MSCVALSKGVLCWQGHSRTRELDTVELLEHLPALQQLLFRLMGCQVRRVVQLLRGLMIGEFEGILVAGGLWIWTEVWGWFECRTVECNDLGRD